MKEAIDSLTASERWTYKYGSAEEREDILRNLADRIKNTGFADKKYNEESKKIKESKQREDDPRCR